LNRNEIIAFIGLMILLVATIFITYQTHPEQTEPPHDNHEQNDNDDSNDNGNNNDNDDRPDPYWGVDSASNADENLYQCVTDNFGKPIVWGRYLGGIEGVSAGLDEDEVDFLHNNDSHILIIYNHFNDATGYDHGVEEAEKAIKRAQDLGIPEGVGIFGDIEPTYDVDADFINGWYDTLDDSDYAPGIYGVFNEDGTVLAAYLDADDDTQANTILWTAYPQEEITSKDDAPDYNPQGPDNSKLFGWQYGTDAEQCNIDTNLFTEDMLDYLWQPNDS